jgi:membrane protease YdiL (CAAX protease family)
MRVCLGLRPSAKIKVLVMNLTCPLLPFSTFVQVEQQAVSRWDVSEAWLAAAESDPGLRRMYERLGYEVRCGGLGQMVMRKPLPRDAPLAPAAHQEFASAVTERSLPLSAADDSLGNLVLPSSNAGPVPKLFYKSHTPSSDLDTRAPGSGISAAALATELAVQGMHIGIPSSAAEPHGLNQPYVSTSGVDTGAYDAGTTASALATELAVQGMYIGIACLGIFFLLQPFGGTRLSQMIPSGEDPVAALCEAGLGLALAGGELARLGAWPFASEPRGTNSVSPDKTIKQPISPPAQQRSSMQPLTPGSGSGPITLAQAAGQPITPAEQRSRMQPITQGQAAQLAPLWRIAGREISAPAALAAIGLWQLSIAIAEEAYYRGLVLSGLRSAILGLSGVKLSVPDSIASLFALLLSSAVFGAVHLEFASAAEPGDAVGMQVAAKGEPGNTAGGQEAAKDDSAARWFWVPAAYGAAYGGLFLATGLHLLAPVCLHAGINTGLCMGRWRQLRAMGDEAASALFASEGEEAGTSGGWL